ncbi:F0F1 ATP synthase subunit gamma [Corynebacterium yudongzhengii]|uniref:ATP synthase gamma chain n=1 Tax=Corynebacterium yudongzhengii TaxID=2080740 RepID=A0A2U1T9A8_9CORY|nr:F0F1 ATP synthase subunit gamma [Corynebacterium yudongzhengii]AWB82100.1 F0F1 ATP synthase subunit gamma [Corynebacterium yudongzhengii]PWC02604.1 F0F1 ATP synthase subunit gamma [Corynebacterium yudongzhengii]
MATLRETRDRIRSVNSTKKITKAQELIATSRITKAQNRVQAAQPYAHELTDVVARVAAATSMDHPMLNERENPQVAAIMVVTSDRGQCGGYNNNVLKKAAELEEHLKERGLEVVRYVTGAKGIGYYQFRDIEISGSWTGFSENPEWEKTHDARHHLVRGFEAGSEGEAKWRPGLNVPEGETIRGFDEVHVVYTEFQSMLAQVPRVQRLLPVRTVFEDQEFEVTSATQSAGEVTADMDFEPDADTLLKALMPQYVSRVLYSIFLEAAASEYAARRTAMKNATDNANDLVQDLTRVANQARQAQITQEITEIIGGAGALADSGESD